MGRGACKTSHLGKNTLKNRRFLESNNADSGERVRGLPESGAQLQFRGGRGAGSENSLASPAVCRPPLATSTAVSSLFFLEKTLFTQHPHICISKACPLLRWERGPAFLSPPQAQLAPTCVCLGLLSPAPSAAGAFLQPALSPAGQVFPSRLAFSTGLPPPGLWPSPPRAALDPCQPWGSGLRQWCFCRCWCLLVLIESRFPVTFQLTCDEDQNSWCQTAV